MTSVPWVGNQLPPFVTLDQTTVVGRVLLADVVPAEKARGTVIVDEKLFIAGARAERVCSLVAHIIVLLSLTESKESDEKTKADHPGQRRGDD